MHTRRNGHVTRDTIWTASFAAVADALCACSITPSVECWQVVDRIEGEILFSEGPCRNYLYDISDNADVRDKIQAQLSWRHLPKVGLPVLHYTRIQIDEGLVGSLFDVTQDMRWFIREAPQHQSLDVYLEAI